MIQLKALYAMVIILAPGWNLPAWQIYASAENRQESVPVVPSLITGVIQQIDPADPGAAYQGTILLQPAGDKSQQHAIIVRVPRATRVIRRTIQGSTIMDFNALKPGNEISVTIQSGGQMLSYPPQVVAMEITLVSTSL